MKLTAFSAAAILAFTSFAAAVPVPDDDSSVAADVVPVRWNDVEADVVAAQASADGNDINDVATPTDSADPSPTDATVVATTTTDTAQTTADAEIGANDSTDTSANDGTDASPTTAPSTDDSTGSDDSSTETDSTNTIAARSNKNDNNNNHHHDHHSAPHQTQSNPANTKGKSGAEGNDFHGGSKLFGRAPERIHNFNGGKNMNHQHPGGFSGSHSGGPPGGKPTGAPGAPGKGNMGQMSGGKPHKRAPMPKKHRIQTPANGGKKDSIQGENPFDHGGDHKNDPSWG